MVLGMRSQTEQAATGWQQPNRPKEGGLRLCALQQGRQRGTPLVSIITVVRNGAGFLEQTIRSVRDKRSGVVEYIVIDGASDDGTLEIIRANEVCIDYWLSEPDSGIFDAMNKGIACSTGKYLLFLNARDMLVADIGQLRDILENDFVLVYGKANMLAHDGKLSYVKGRALKSHRELHKGMRICHQAIFFRRDLIGLYDTTYRLLADRVKVHDMILSHGIDRTRFVDLPIADYFEGGISRQCFDLLKEEEFRFLRSIGRGLYALHRKFGWLFRKNMKEPWRAFSKRYLLRKFEVSA
jgi:glycosyltransferase involved in cell wall biosynthesis